MKQWLSNNSPIIASVGLVLSPILLVLLKWGMIKMEEYFERRKENGNKR